MRRTFILLATAMALFMAGPLSSADFRPISSEAEFRSLVVGKKLWLNENHVTARKNGKIVGNFDGARLKGAWAWRDGYWCRTLTTHSKNTDCQAWETDGSSFRVTRQKGKGKSFVYTQK